MTFNATMRSVDYIKFVFKCYNNSLNAVNAFWPWQKQNSDFQFLAFPKTNFKNFLKGIFVQEGSSGTRFDHGQFEIKTFPIYTLP